MTTDIPDANAWALGDDDSDDDQDDIYASYMDDIPSPRDGADDTAPEPSGRPQVNVGNEAESYGLLLAAMADPRVPQLYVRSGSLNRITADDKGDAKITALRESSLLSWFAENVDTHILKAVGRGEDQTWEAIAKYPSARTCSAIIGRQEWDLPRLEGIVTSPVLRPDGTLLTSPGYDAATGLYHFPKLEGIGIVPAVPTAEQLTEALHLVLAVVQDFPFVAASDKAQFIAAMFVPILRPYVPGPTPLFVVTATMPGSGKTLLTLILEAMYGMGTLTWPAGETDELRKVITTKLTQTGAPVLTFDNVDNGATLKSPVLADLLTKTYWEDRILGSTANVGAPNDRLWMVTGNNIRTGGDMARRTIWVRLDPRMPNPEQRDGFALGDLDIWLTSHAGELLHALLTLAAGWIAAGAPRETVRLGGYSTWASAVAGLLEWAQIPGFMADRDATTIGMDEEVAEWHALLEAWYGTYASQPQVVRDVLNHTDLSEFIPAARTGPPSSKQLGHWLNARMGRYFGPYRLERADGPKRLGAFWRVVKLDTTEF